MKTVKESYSLGWAVAKEIKFLKCGSILKRGGGITF